MADIIVNDLNKYYGGNHILKGLSFEIYEGEKVGILGKNGSGKTTLFKVLTKEELFESGSINIQKGKNVEVLDQIPIYNEEFTSIDVINTAFENVFSIKASMKELENKMQHGHTEDLLKKYGSLQHKLEHLDGYNTENAINRVCNGLGITLDVCHKLFTKLSGGEKTRINLARILLKKADILLLDEPTNHLDIRAVEWLEEFISQFDGTVLIISHDRYFLDRTIKKSIELIDGKAEFYAGNYSYYLVERELRFQRKLEMYEQQQKKVDQLETAAKRMHDWANRSDNPSMHKKAVAIEKRLERLDTIEKPKSERKIGVEFTTKGFSGKDVIVLEDVEKRFGDRVLWKHANLTIQRNERVAIIGDNGTGKTTLLKLIMGDIAPEKGVVKLGNSIKPAYLPQLVSFEKPEFTVLDTIRYEFETSEEKARFILAPFNFKGEDVLKTVSSLSGGEKSRLRLCILMQNDCNLLMLDEPTNHLDLSSREWIEKSVSDFKGTVVFISHDRYFINRFATRIWSFENLKINDFIGTYSEFLDWKQLELQKNLGKSEFIKETKVELKKNTKLTFTAQMKEKLELEIADFELGIKEIEKEMELSASDFKRLEELIKLKEIREAELELMYEKWMNMK